MTLCSIILFTEFAVKGKYRENFNLIVHIIINNKIEQIKQIYMYAMYCTLFIHM